MVSYEASLCTYVCFIKNFSEITAFQNIVLPMQKTNEETDGKNGF